ncbi:MAG TPA: alpha-amylase family glycosyl hydrolase [Acidimicrobiales bacterium]|nr:alpha-amylase family glycosyl hydrolase [Acidimicrobiales bacterium]
MRRDVPPWLPGLSWYHLHALRASGAADVNPDVSASQPSGHALRLILDRLDHVAALGCGGILLTPVTVSSTHGYDTVDPFRIDQRLGDDDDFDALVAGCRARGLRLVLDGVLNHVGRAFPRFVDVLERRNASSSVDWFCIDWDAAGHGDDGFGYRDFEGHPELVALNHHSSEVLDWAADVCLHWLQRGADGWRFDVAYALPRPFLADVSRRVLGAHHDAFLFGEMIHGDYAGFVAESGLHSVTQYELHKACWSACNDRNLFELAWALRRHAEMATTFVPVTFGGNHDVTRLASRLEDRRHLEVVLTALFVLPGTVCVYYGDEWGALGEKSDGAGGDDAIRPRLDDLRRDVDLEDVHRRLIAFRRDRPWLTDGVLEIGAVANERLEVVVTGESGRRSIAATLDLTGAERPSPPATAVGWAAVDGLRGVWERA